MMASKKCLTPRQGARTQDKICCDLSPALKDEEGQKKYINFEIRITDSGCGISPQNLNKLFLNFSRLEEH
jgi:signal transduction histidine kinase